MPVLRTYPVTLIRFLGGHISEITFCGTSKLVSHQPVSHQPSQVTGRAMLQSTHRTVWDRCNVCDFCPPGELQGSARDDQKCSTEDDNCMDCCFSPLRASHSQLGAHCPKEHPPWRRMSCRILLQLVFPNDCLYHWILYTFHHCHVL